MNRRSFIQCGSLSIGSALASFFTAGGMIANARNSRDELPRCRVVPRPDDQASFHIGKRVPVKWHYSSQYPRPFFYPFNGPSGSPLTRMGHPGAPNHDHHRSIWLAHHNLEGNDFWSDRTDTQIRQKRWLVYQDNDDEALMAVSLGWFAANGQELIEQELVSAIRPGPRGETFLELQSTFTPTSGSVTFGKTNFGFLAVRVAKYLSEHFGGGTLTNSHGQKGEPAIFGKRAKWMDYSGPVPKGDVEGISYFDHPDNPNFPSYWHVREDGWMGASVCMDQARTVSQEKPLRLRYLLHAHHGSCDPERAEQIANDFAQSPGHEVVNAEVKHRQFQIQEQQGD